MSASEVARLWQFLPWGFVLTVAIELPILVVGLSRRHAWRQRVAAGVWLTACTYPVVVLVLPVLLHAQARGMYLAVAEVFAPAAEMALFWWAFDRRGAVSHRQIARDLAVIGLANLASFLLGEALL